MRVCRSGKMRVPLLDQGMLQRSMGLARLMPTSCFYRTTILRRSLRFALISGTFSTGQKFLVSCSLKKIEGHFATWKKHHTRRTFKTKGFFLENKRLFAKATQDSLRVKCPLKTRRRRTQRQAWHTVSFQLMFTILHVKKHLQ